MNDPTRAPSRAARLRAALVVLACLLCALPASGQGQEAIKVHVLHMAANLAHAYDAVRLTKALEQKVLAAKGVTFVNRNKALLEMLGKAKCGEAFLKSFETEAPLAEDADRSVSEACEARLAPLIGAPFKPSEGYVWGYLYEGPDKQLRATVHLWRRGQPGRKVTLPYDPNAAEHVAARLARHLFEEGRVGDVKLTAAGPMQGELYANDELVGRWSPPLHELTLATGVTRFEVRAGGKVVARGQGEVRAEARALVALEPVVEPPPAPPAPAFASPAPVSTTPPPPPSGRWMKPAGWVALGTGTVLIGAGVFGTLRASSLGDEFSSDRGLAQYRAGLRQGADTCDAADRNDVSQQPGAASPAGVRDHCSSLAFARTLRPVGFVSGGLLAVGGAVLLLTAPASSEPEATASGAGRWRFAPALGRSTAGGTLSLTW